MSTAKKIVTEAMSIYVENDYDKMTLSLIAGNIGIKKPSIYSHYSNKEEIFRVMLDEEFKTLLDFFINEILSLANNNNQEKIYSEIFIRVINYILEDDIRKRFWHKIFFNPPVNFKDNIKGRIETLATEFINRMMVTLDIKHLEHKTFEEKRIILDSFIAYIFGIISLTVYDESLISSDILEDYWRIYWNGIKSEFTK